MEAIFCLWRSTISPFCITDRTYLYYDMSVVREKEAETAGHPRMKAPGRSGSVEKPGPSAVPAPDPGSKRIVIPRPLRDHGAIHPVFKIKPAKASCCGVRLQPVLVEPHRPPVPLSPNNGDREMVRSR